jgi:hypothetical protein
VALRMPLRELEPTLRNDVLREDGQGKALKSCSHQVARTIHVTIAYLGKMRFAQLRRTRWCMYDSQWLVA